MVLYDLEHQTYLFVMCQNIVKESKDTEEGWKAIRCEDRHKQSTDYLRAFATDTVAGKTFTPGFKFERTSTWIGKRKRKHHGLRKGKVFQKKLWNEYLQGLARQRQQEELAYAANQKQSIMASCRSQPSVDVSEMNHPPPILVIEGFYNMLPEKKKSSSR